MNIHSLQHVWFEDLGYIRLWAEERGHTITTTRLFEEEPLPSPSDIDWLIVLGGPMNIYEEDSYPWLAREKAFIKSAIKEKKRVLGLCLGAQLIADVLGGKVTQNQCREIGWFTVTKQESSRSSSLLRSLPSSLMAFHWHGDTFSLPPRCERVITNHACRNQGFQYEGHVLGLQFHLESTPQSVELLVEHCGAEIVVSEYVHSAQSILGQRTLLPEMNKNMSIILSNFEHASITT